jgi:succinate dehydrogenase / fumarate reductase membrane anchor subunit
MSLRTPMSRVLGNGPARGGAVHHWWVQRVSSIALVPLTAWLLVALLRLPLADHAAVTQWIGADWNALWLALTILVMAWHSVLGVQVVIEDYVHGAAAKTASLLLSQLVHWLTAAAAVYAVLRIAFRGA